MCSVDLDGGAPDPDPSASGAAVEKVPATSATDSEDAAPARQKGRVIASAATIGGLLLLVAAGAVFKDQIGDFLAWFTSIVDDMGAPGVVLYALVYAALEVLAVPAIPLTMTAGAIFGIPGGALIVSFAGTVAATISFLIARYVARDKVRLAMAAPRAQGLWSVLHAGGQAQCAAPLLPGALAVAAVARAANARGVRRLTIAYCSG